MEIFIDDDDGYEHWLSQHPDGFVINTYATPSASYLVLHRADCHHIDITRGRAGRRWTHQYLKACSGQRETLMEWSEQALGAAPTRCRTCSP